MQNYYLVTEDFDSAAYADAPVDQTAEDRAAIDLALWQLLVNQVSPRRIIDGK